MDIWTTGCMKKSCWRGSTSQCGRDWAETWLRWEKCGPTKTKVSFQNMAEVCVESEWCRNSLIFIVSSSDFKKSMWWLGLEVLHEKIIELDQAISVVKPSVLCLATAMNRPTVHDAPNTSSLWVYLRMFVWTWWGFSVALGNGLVFVPWELGWCSFWLLWTLVSALWYAKVEGFGKENTMGSSDWYQRDKEQ